MTGLGNGYRVFHFFQGDKYGVPNGTLCIFSLVFFTNMLSLTGQIIVYQF